jgi:hypothetical protein
MICNIVWTIKNYGFAILVFITSMPNSSNAHDQGCYMVQKSHAFFKNLIITNWYHGGEN